MPPPLLADIAAAAAAARTTDGTAEEEASAAVPSPPSPTSPPSPAVPLMLPLISVHFGAEVHFIRVQPGDVGRRQFERDVRRALNLEETQVRSGCRASVITVTGKMG